MRWRQGGGIIPLALLLMATSCASPTTEVPPGTDTKPSDGATAPAVSTGTGPVGFIGCSMTMDSVRGYQRLGGDRLWSAEEVNYGLGTLAAWAESGDDERYWDQLRRGFADHQGTDEIWWQLCAGDQGEEDVDAALVVLDRLRRVAPDATVFVSAQPGYLEGHVCPIAGPEGPVEMQELVDAVVDEGGVDPGPVFEALDPDLLRDRCHVGRAGQELVGVTLLEFFPGD